MLGDIKRLQKILIYKVSGSDAIYRKWKCKHYNNLRLEKIQLKSLINIEELYLEDCEENTIEYIAHMYLEHRFNYLGSGWVNVGYNSEVVGVEENRYNPVYMDEKEYFSELQRVLSTEEWMKLCEMKKNIDSEYVFIHWNRDYKSGYTWRVDYIDEKESTSLPPGADVKTVWELGRLEFVLQLALAAIMFPNKRELYISGFKNVVLDFMCSNPVGIGPNWIIPMETAIRSIHLLLAYDIFMQLDETSVISKEVSVFFVEQIYKYGKFIYDNLEKGIGFKSGNANHYYSNIIGLLYISTYLSEYKEAKMWYRFAKKEFEKESILQFYEDGGNIEASTAYHRFMTEMLVFGAAIIKRNGDELSEGIKKRIVRATFFLETIVKNNGNIIQIGDNDSGRFVNPVMYGEMLSNQEAEKKYKNLEGYCEVYGKADLFFDENNLNALSTIGFAQGLYFDDTIMKPKKYTFETSLIEAIAKCGGEFVSIEYDYKKEITPQNSHEEIQTAYKMEKKISCFNEGKGEWGYFPDFGLFFVKNDMLNCYVYTGGGNGRKLVGHSHNDLMHCELNLAGEDLLYDRGTYLYIQNQYLNYFRGYRAHSVPDFGREPRKIIRAWVYEGTEHVDVLSMRQDKIVLHYASDYIEYWREIQLGKNEIRIVDYSQEPFVDQDVNQDLYSNGYGKLLV